jgi:hypothetical protein
MWGGSEHILRILFGKLLHETTTKFRSDVANYGNASRSFGNLTNALRSEVALCDQRIHLAPVLTQPVEIGELDLAAGSPE